MTSLLFLLRTEFPTLQLYPELNFVIIKNSFIEVKAMIFTPIIVILLAVAIGSIFYYRRRLYQQQATLSNRPLMQGGEGDDEDAN